MAEIIICATQRCGSTMVIEDMRNTNVLGVPEEWFIEWNPEKNNHDWQADLVGLRQQATGENGVTAIKVMADQLHNIDSCLAKFVKSTGVGTFPAFHATFASAIWVHIVRRDIVYQAVSRVMAQQTGINHAVARPEDEHFAGNLMRGYKSDYNAKSRYNYDQLLSDSTAVILENLCWDHFFEMHNIKPIRLVYEDVVADSKMLHLDSMAEQLGLEDNIQKLPRKLVKLGNELNEKWRSRFYDEASRAAFKVN